MATILPPDKDHRYIRIVGGFGSKPIPLWFKITMSIIIGAIVIASIIGCIVNKGV